MIQAESARIEDGISAKTGPIVTTPKQNRAWHFPIKLLVSFVEAVGRSSEEFHVYFSPGERAGDQEAPNV